MSTTPGMRCSDMIVTTTVRSWGAILLGGIFALGTAYVLFAHVRGLADITTDHVMTGLVLVGTIAAVTCSGRRRGAAGYWQRLGCWPCLFQARSSASRGRPDAPPRSPRKGGRSQEGQRWPRD